MDPQRLCRRAWQKEEHGIQMTHLVNAYEESCERQHWRQWAAMPSSLHGGRVVRTVCERVLLLPLPLLQWRWAPARTMWKARGCVPDEPCGCCVDRISGRSVEAETRLRSEPRTRVVFAAGSVRHRCQTLHRHRGCATGHPRQAGRITLPRTDCTHTPYIAWCCFILLLLTRAVVGGVDTYTPRTHTCAHVHAHTYTRTHVHTHTRTHAHTYTHTCAHARARVSGARTSTRQRPRWGVKPVL
jgi:hypothetical protein